MNLARPKLIKCRNAGLSGSRSVRYWNKQKCQCQNQPGAEIRWPSSVPECSSTGLRCRMPECRCRLHLPWCRWHGVPKINFFFGWNILTGGFGDLGNNSLPSPLPPTRHTGICPKRKYLWGVRGQNTQPFNREGSRLKRIVLGINKDFALKRNVSWDGLGFLWIDLRP